MAKHLNITLSRKCLQNYDQKPGSVTAEEPTIIYITMIKRPQRYPEGSKMANICSLRNKFNDLLNETASHTEGKILFIKTCDNPDCFDHFGNLSSKGKRAFRIEVDDLIKKFDTNKVKLMPKTRDDTKTHATGSHDKRHKTPVHSSSLRDRRATPIQSKFIEFTMAINVVEIQTRTILWTESSEMVVTTSVHPPRRTVMHCHT